MAPPEMTSPIGIYVHIPFCTQKCRYCNFYSLPAGQAEIQRYFEALRRAIRGNRWIGREVDTVYFGGGTPPLLGAARLNTLLQDIKTQFALSPDAELSLEANPGSLAAAELDMLRQGGFNRISFGVQSADTQELAALGRMHTPQQAQAAVLAAKAAGFENISLDLMLGIPRQTPESLARSIAFACALPVNHLSAYLLKLEPDTPLASQTGLLKMIADEDTLAQMYLCCVTQLEQRGFLQYEISNFSRPGCESRHNLKYWRCEEYLGLGPAAHSFSGGRRQAFAPDLQRFCNAENPATLLQDTDDGGGLQEYAMLRLRLVEGLDLKQAARQFPAAPLEEILRRAKTLQAHGLLAVANHTIALTARGFLLSNSVIAHLLFG
jgi:putative oxygen-independent coproporphyrinogen III oxidase